MLDTIVIYRVIRNYFRHIIQGYSKRFQAHYTGLFEMISGTLYRVIRNDCLGFNNCHLFL